MSFFANFIKGIAIGAGAILPGISSGVLCVIFGIYENLLNCVLNFFKNIKHNFIVLFPFIVGAFCGIVLFGNVLKYIFYAYPKQSNIIFIALILSSIPELFKKALHSEKSNFKPYHIIYLILSFLLALLLIFIENKLHSSYNKLDEFSFAFIAFSGFLMSAGVIVPGISSTLILMILGIYNAYIISISSVFIPFLFPLGIGLLIGCLIWMKIIKFFFEKFYTQTFFCIIGFTIGSLINLILFVVQF